MGRHYRFRPGSFYRQDDRSGFIQRAEDTKKEWTGAIVDESLFESRQPQDLVRGVKDIQSVPEARPLPPATFIGPTSTTLAQAAAARATIVFPSDPLLVQAGSKVGVMMDNGVSWMTTLQSLNGDGSWTLTAAINFPAAAGNSLFNYGS